MAGGILDLIDSAVRDWETSPDAMRYNSAPETGREVRDGVDWSAVAESVGAWSEGFRLINEQLAQFSISALAAIERFIQALGLASVHGAPGAPPCACHPAPFPAARDYRRRTKHRNRRR